MCLHIHSVNISIIGPLGSTGLEWLHLISIHPISQDFSLYLFSFVFNSFSFSIWYSDPPEITNLPAVYKVAVQGSVSLHCKAVGIPLPSFAWAPCDDPQENVCNKSWLSISQAMNDGVYTCTVKNNLASDSGKAFVGKMAHITCKVKHLQVPLTSLILS